MLRAELRYLQTEVGCVHNVLADPGNFIPEYYGISVSDLRDESVEHHGPDGLFCAHYGIAVILQTSDGFHCVIDMFPFHTVLCSERRLVYLCRRGNCAYAAEPYLVYLERVCRAEGGTYVMGAAYIVKNYDDT